MGSSDIDYWIRGPIHDIEVVFDADGSARGRVGWNGGLMYILVTQCAGGFQCWHCGDDSSPLAPDEAIALGEPAATAWLALPKKVRDSMWELNPHMPIQ